MIIDVRAEPDDDFGFRYESDVIPRIGETLTVIGQGHWEVLYVDHLVRYRENFKKNTHDLVTVIVKPT